MATGAVPAPDRDDRTSDGVPIMPGLAFWNSNLDADVIVSFAFEENGCGWYNTRSGLFNGERMVTRHPVTRALA